MEGTVSVRVYFFFFLNYILKQFLKNILLLWYLSLPSIQFNELSLFKHKNVFSAVSYVSNSWVSQMIFRVTHKLLTNFSWNSVFSL